MEAVALPGVVVRGIAVGGMDNNVYLLTAASGDQLLVDAAADPTAIGRLLADASADAASPLLRYVLTTHSHRDHLAALAAVTAAHPDAETLAGDDDADAITSVTGVAIDRRLGNGDVVDLGGVGPRPARPHPGLGGPGVRAARRPDASVHR